MGVDVPGGVYSHIAGVDIVRAGNPDGSGSTTCSKTTCACPAV